MALVLAHRDAKGLLLLHEKRPYNPFCVIFPERSEIATLRKAAIIGWLPMFVQENASIKQKTFTCEI